jgi:hypothetical protein
MKKLYMHVVKFELDAIEAASSKIIEKEIIEVTNEYVLLKDKTKYSRSFENKKFVLELDEISEDIPALEQFYIEYYGEYDSYDAYIVQQGFIYDDEKDDAELIKSKAEIVKNNCTKLFLDYADQQIKAIKKAKNIVKNCPYRVK